MNYRVKPSLSAAFTLIEVIVAISVLAVAMLGVYSLVNQSIFMATYGREKDFVSDRAFERVALSLHYPRSSWEPSEEVKGKGKITYEVQRTPTLLPGVTSVILTVKSNDAAVIYEYFERN
ncbi:MAG: prepilin-type N-terminal cleavage/methylation domain-containing protein [Deferribacteraceae bacterium]|jgi:prepilin-type N-terminal cleavage/methylation domain-containing protein|nr:prepilin-type N-terminal cleavage/methylation domain-containing protein [Deferribacteraceae bacterium]